MIGKVVIVEPNKSARIEEIDFSLESMQKVVGGSIEQLCPFDEDVCIVCNEEGKIRGLPLNRPIYMDGVLVDIICGTFFICDCSGEDFSALSEEQLKKYSEIYKYDIFE